MMKTSMHGGLLRRFVLVLGTASTAGLAGPAHAQELRIVATIPTYAAIAREITGDLADIQSIARGDEDSHFVNARPSFAALIQRADVFISTGLDLELWAPSLLDRANNPKVIEGGPGNVVAYTGVALLDIPQNVSRTGGDVHVFGNPHIHTDPINAIIISRNILATLKRVAPNHAETFQSNAESFADRVLHRLFGDQLVEMLGAETLFDLARGHQFWDFANNQSFQGRPLASYVGGWLAAAEPFRNRQLVCYHKNWAYFSARFLAECAMWVEPKPGIPASPGHVREVIDFIRENDIPALFAANYYSRSQIERVAERTGAAAVIVPVHTDGEEGISDYFALVDSWVNRLAAAFASH